MCAWLVLRSVLSSHIMGLEECYGKKYKLASSEKFDDFMKALGVSFAIRQAGIAVSPVVEISESHGLYTLKSSSTFKNIVMTFKLNEPFDQQTPDGRKVKSTITMEGDNTLVEVQTGGSKPAKIVRVFSADEIKMASKNRFFLIFEI